MEKILITGTGRSGTTFLIKLFTFLDFDTGYTKANYINFINKSCNSGMEKEFNSPNYVLKNPTYIEKIDDIFKTLSKNKINIKLVIIPIRDYKESAASRVSYKIHAGGLWNAKNEGEQILFYNKIMANYLFYMTKYEINTLFLDFVKMVNDKEYLFNKLKNILDEKNITFDVFSSVYDEVTEISKPKNKK
jgi:hypothetical protein